MGINTELNWENPDPYDYRYIEYLYNMFLERVYISNYTNIYSPYISRYNLPPPQKNNYCSKQYYLMLIGGIQRLIIYGPFIDGDFRQYTEDGKSRYSLMYFPKKIDYQNFTDWELQFNVVKTWTKDEMSEKLSQIHSILSKLRYSLRQ